MASRQPERCVQMSCGGSRKDPKVLSLEQREQGLMPREMTLKSDNASPSFQEAEARVKIWSLL